jgi:hypothetical protein
LDRAKPDALILAECAVPGGRGCVGHLGVASWV